MNKVGIITLSASDNCGSLLQTYALQQIVNKRYGYDVEIINYISKQSKSIYDLFPYDFYKHPKKTLFTLRYLKSIMKQKVGYQEFRNNYLNMSSKIYSDVNELMKLSNKYDFLITGSDQVWNTNMSDYSDAFFLPWKDGAKKIAYAASLGATQIFDEKKITYIKRWLEDIDNISVREETGRATIQQLTKKEVKLTADPTLLLCREDWDNLIGERKIEESYIFFYSWSYPNIDMNKHVQKFASEMGLSVYVINSSKWYKYRPEKFDFILFEESGPSIFLNLMKYADYVFVQSFHGAVFANLLKKRFFFLNEKENGQVDFRTKNLIDMLHEEKQVVHNYEDIREAMYTELVYTNQEYEAFIDKSFIFLDEAMARLGDKYE